MCWNKESSLVGFISNILILFLHKNNKSKKFIPLFITVALTQLFDFFIYLKSSKKIFNKLLTINIIIQIFLLYNILKLPKYLMIFPFISIFYLNKWKPYNKYNKGIIQWNENNQIKKILWVLWIIIPIIFLLQKQNQTKNIQFLIIGGILLYLSELINFGSLGKNWCMLGIILNIITFYIYKK